jgi:hypothetical protein
VEEFDPEDDPGWIGLEEGEGDDEDDGLAIGGDWYPGLPVFRWRFGFDERDAGDEGEDEDDDDEGDEDAAYESDFIDDEHDTGIPRGSIRQLPHIYELLSDDSDNEDHHSHVDADLPSEEDEPSFSSRPRRTAPIVVSSDDEDEDELDSSIAIRPLRPRRGRLVESDDEVEVLGSSDGSSQ